MYHGIPFHFCTLCFKFIFRSKKLICFFLSETGNYMEAENKYSRAMRGAPADSLFGQFCLHALWFGNCNIRGLYHVLISLLICDFWKPLLIKDSFLQQLLYCGLILCGKFVGAGRNQKDCLGWKALQALISLLVLSTKSYKWYINTFLVSKATFPRTRL